jgi:hypothetical protein
MSMYGRNALKAHDDSHLIKAMQVCGMNKKDLSLAMGLSVSAVPAWLKSGNIPLWSVLAAEGLMAKYRVDDPLLVVKLPHSQEATVRAVLNGLGCKVAKIK